MIPHIHQVEQHKTSVRGIEAMTLCSNHHFPRHTHDQFGCGVVLGGAHRSWSGIGQVEASAGEAIMCSPGEVHDGVPIEGKVRRWRMLYFDPALVAAELAGEDVGAIEFIRPVARDEVLVERFRHLFGCVTGAQSDHLAMEENMLRALMYILRRHGMARPPGSSLSPPVDRAIRRLDAAPELSVSLAELAALSGVSRFQLLRSFAREMGITPHAYLLQRRVRLARQLLAHGRTPAQAAILAGFADQAHMTRVFVRQVGITPRRYQAAIA
ncbi:MAG TPA: AraC family transcriptional regulator [Candidatus Sulfotelmatobacter sp.]|nr:AraC family transcriptional regulator [Candidatus Sulfotelmatobacter sp.]